MKRIGVFGGAFDPPHRAHRALAEAALAQFALDELRILPTGRAWHKAPALSPAEHRVAMARLAFADLPRVLVDDRETRRDGATYTFDTLRELRAEQPDAQWFLFIGADQAQAFTGWHRWAEILDMAELVVAGRPVAAEGTPAADAVPSDALGATAAPEPGREPGRGGKRAQWHNPVSPAAHRLDMPLFDLSATRIRQAVARGEDTDDWLHPAVADHIRQHHLYTARHE